jgi:hypothetical protein
MNTFTPFSGTRTGKIARLPRRLREELNLRLDDGVSVKHVVAWLNALPETRAMLEREFEGRPINEQNVCAWKRGGFQDWLRMEAVGGWVRSLAEDGVSLREAAGGENLEKTVETLNLMAMARIAEEAFQEPDLAKKARVALGVARELARARQIETEKSRQRLELTRLEWMIAREATARPRVSPSEREESTRASAQSHPTPMPGKAPETGAMAVARPSQAVQPEGDQAGLNQINVTPFPPLQEKPKPGQQWSAAAGSNAGRPARAA